MVTGLSLRMLEVTDRPLEVSDAELAEQEEGEEGSGH